MTDYREDEDLDRHIGLDLSATGLLVLAIGFLAMIVMGPLLWMGRKIIPSPRPPTTAAPPATTVRGDQHRRPAA